MTATDTQRTEVRTDGLPHPGECARGAGSGAGVSVSGVVMFRVYLTMREDFGPMNEVYGEFIDRYVTDGEKPCGTTVFVAYEVMLVEIDAQAVVNR